MLDISHYRKDLIFLEKIYYDLLIENGDLSCFRKTRGLRRSL
jgi:hypothetical protein